MLQTRAGRCPNCDEEVAPEARTCPNCGRALEWNKTNDAQRHAAHVADRAGVRAHDGKSTPVGAAPRGSGASALRLLMLFVIACAAFVAAATIRTKFFNRTDAPNLTSEHATNVQDAEAFRDQIKTSQANSDAPETAFVIGMAMPNGKDVLEITVKNNWKILDYPTRLGYAAKFVERWKNIHAPNRANISILDESGNPIGGRTWNGTVWVVEKDDALAAKAKPKTPGTGGAPNANSTANTATNSASTPSVPGAANNATPNSAASAATSSTANATTNSTTNATSNATTNSAAPSTPDTPVSAPKVDDLEIP